jgi:catechol 2,3-dioxygenase-like lactoylglutathione lyase family enzyme
MLPLARSAAARGQTGPSQLRARTLNHVTLSVSDVGRSVEFYQGLFGLPIQARQGATSCLRLGSGPQFLELAPAPRGTQPRIDHFGLGIEDFDVEQALGVLRAHGVAVGPNPSEGAMRARGVTSSIVHGLAEPTRKLFLSDPDGTVVQLQGTNYCGGTGRNGDVCSPVKPSPTSGRLAVRDLSHLTIASNDARTAHQFYQDVFGLPVQAHQGASPLLGVGSGVQFLMFTGAAAAGQPPRPTRIDHLCLSLPWFDIGAIVDALTGAGITPRAGAAGRPGPMVSYVSMRMPNRGGAPEGTPELYFTDPDGIAIQLQDVRYCGGGGVLGDVCPA